MRYVDFLFPASCPVLLHAVSFKRDFCLPTKWFQIKQIFWLFMLSWLLLIAFVWYYLSRLTALHMFFGACWVILCFHNLPISGMDYKMTGSLTHICDVFACVSTWGTSSLIRVLFNWDFHSVFVVVVVAILVAGPALLMWNDQWMLNLWCWALLCAMCQPRAAGFCPCLAICIASVHFIALLTSCLIPFINLLNADWSMQRVLTTATAKLDIVLYGQIPLTRV